jgi:hypothetical protein
MKIVRSLSVPGEASSSKDHSGKMNKHANPDLGSSPLPGTVVDETRNTDKMKDEAES